MSHAFDTDRLSVTFGGTRALADVTVRSVENHILGLVGRNGAGKTTLLRVLAGMEPRFAGSVHVFGEDISRLGRRRSTVRLSGPLRGWTVQSFRRDLADAYPTFDPAVADRLLRQFGVRGGGWITSLSVGQRSAVQVALSLACRAPLTLLDEPTLGMDAHARAVVARSIIEEQTESPRTIVVSTHLIDEAAPLFERLLLLDCGRLILDGEPESLARSFAVADGTAAAINDLPPEAIVSSRALGGRVSAVVRRELVPAASTLRLSAVTPQQLTIALGDLTEEGRK